ncbi:hypothetical protein ACVJBD_007502 [Rhizobium mongolense]
MAPSAIPPSMSTLNLRLDHSQESLLRFPQSTSSTHKTVSCRVSCTGFFCVPARQLPPSISRNPLLPQGTVRRTQLEQWKKPRSGANSPQLKALYSPTYNSLSSRRVRGGFWQTSTFSPSRGIDIMRPSAAGLQDGGIVKIGGSLREKLVQTIGRKILALMVAVTVLLRRGGFFRRADVVCNFPREPYRSDQNGRLGYCHHGVEPGQAPRRFQSNDPRD